MTNVKHYCITCDECGTFGNEKAPICGRSLFGVSWGTLNRVTEDSSILALPIKARNTFYAEFHG